MVADGTLLFGCYDDGIEGGRPVFAFSSDKVSTIVARISLYKGIAHSGWNLRNKEKLAMNQGWFYYFDSNEGRFTKAISVEKVLTLDGALCQGKGFDYILKNSVVDL